MIRYVILEDEPAAVRRLKRKITALRPTWVFVDAADSLKSGIALVQQEEFDLLFSDIELSDGHSFELLKNIEIEVPIIFITAYHNYAIKAFEFNSIHYLLKPINDQQLRVALQKFEKHPSQLKDAHVISQIPIDEVKQTIISRLGNKTYLIKTDDIAYFHHHDRITKAYLFNSKSYLISQNLEKLIGYLPATNFFRINRQMIVNRNTVTQFSKLSSNRLLLETELKTAKELIVSKENSKPFRQWLLEL